jgi:ABC-2 type transport system ATP-binding protein
VVEGIEVVRPTLDDVFAEQTGHHLEGAGEAQPVVPA